MKIAKCRQCAVFFNDMHALHHLQCICTEWTLYQYETEHHILHKFGTVFLKSFTTHNIQCQQTKKMIEINSFICTILIQFLNERIAQLIEYYNEFFEHPEMKRRRNDFSAIMPLFTYSNQITS